MRVIVPTPDVVFPDPRHASGDIVAVGADLRTSTLRAAYQQGIFPWPHEGLPLLWFSPEQRAVLEFDRLHIPSSLAKAQRKSPFRFTIDERFDDVIAACRQSPRPGQDGTWITPAMIHAYRKLHREGNAHSIEAWDADCNLVGGVYGVDAGGVFCGESMFYHAPNASKLAILFLVEHLRGRGATFMDIQELTPHMERLGAQEIDRDVYLQRLKEAQKQNLMLFPQKREVKEAAGGE